MTARMQLGQSGLQASALGIGAMVWGQPTRLGRWTPAQLAYGPSQSAEEEAEALALSIAAGVNLIDTAAMYSSGASERRVGELLHGSEVLVATKFPPGLFSHIRDFPKALDDSLARLGRSTIDLYQVHFPSGRWPIPAIMHAMADAVESGKVRAVGVSNYSAAQMREAHTELAKRGIPLASNQVQYSLLYRSPEVDGVLDACRELGVTLIAYSPLASGALTGKYTASTRASGFRRFMPNFRGQGIEAVQPVVHLLRRIGERYGQEPGQVALRWLIERGTLPIPGAKNSRQAAANVAALSFSLNAAEIEEIDQATAAWKVAAAR